MFPWRAVALAKKATLQRAERQCLDAIPTLSPDPHFPPPAPRPAKRKTAATLANEARRFSCQLVIIYPFAVAYQGSLTSETRFQTEVIAILDPRMAQE